MVKVAYNNFKLTTLPDSEVEIEAEIPAEDFLPFRKLALKKIGKDAKIPGFRPGHVPEKVLVERFGEVELLEEAARMALAQVYPNIVLKENIDVIGRPEITITKIASGNPLGFKIKTTVLPTFDLPDYTGIPKEILKEKEDMEVQDKEVDAVLLDIRKTRAKAKGAEGADDKSLDTTRDESEDSDLPPLTDDDAKEFGDFKSLMDFKSRIKENLKKEKEIRAKEKKRAQISEKLISKTNVVLPNILVESELDKMISQLREDIRRMGMKYEDYLKNTGKTEEGLRSEWRENALKRAKLQLILNTISEKENIKPEEQELKEHVDHILKHHKNADPENVRVYVRTILTNEKVFAFLEKNKGA